MADLANLLDNTPNILVDAWKIGLKEWPDLVTFELHSNSPANHCPKAHCNKWNVQECRCCYWLNASLHILVVNQSFYVGIFYQLCTPTALVDVSKSLSLEHPQHMLG